MYVSSETNERENEIFRIVGQLYYMTCNSLQQSVDSWHDVVVIEDLKE